MINSIKSRLVAWLKSDFGVALCITLAWKTAMLLIGYLFDDHPTSLLSHTMHWDAGWYTTVITHHYLNEASAAFYPLFPLLVGFIHLVSCGLFDIPFAGQIITTASVWALIAGLIKLGKIFFPQARPWLIPLVLSTPTAFFLHVFYSEALFMALGCFAYLFALKRKWLAMGIALAFLTASRLPGILFVGLCVLEFMRAYQWKIRKIFNKNTFYFLLAPVGFLLYGLYLWWFRGDPLAMFHAYAATNDWSYQVFNPNIFHTIGRISLEVLRALFGERALNLDMLVNHILPLISLGILMASSIYLLFQKGKYIPLGVFGIASFVMFTLNSNVVSAHRYALPCLSIYIAALLLVERWKSRNIALIAICVIGITLQMFLYFVFVSNRFAG